MRSPAFPVAPLRALRPTLGALLCVLAATVGSPRASRAQRPDSLAHRDSVAHRDSIAHRDSVARRDSLARRDRAASATRRGPVAVADTVLGPPISPKRAFLYSLAVPGLGQGKLHRSTAASFFAAVEFISITMARKSASDLRLAKRFAGDSVYFGYQYDHCSTVGLDSLPIPSGTPPGQHCSTLVLGADGQPLRDSLQFNRYRGGRVGARRLHYEDWIAVLVFNHLISGADAFISAQLWDLPTRVAIEPRERGAALAMRVTW